MQHGFRDVLGQHVDPEVWLKKERTWRPVARSTIDLNLGLRSRIALVPFVICYGAWEALQGIATGLIANEVNGLSAADQAIGASLLQDFAEHPLIREMGVLGSIGSTAFIVAMIAAGVALHRHAGASRLVAALLGVAGFLITMHPPPFGPTGLALFAVAVVVYVQPRSS